MSGITDGDYLDLEYEPRSSDLACTFYVEPAADRDAGSAARRVASVSSNDSRAELRVGGDVRDLAATACSVEPASVAGRADREGYRVTVAYPHDLFENGNMPQVLSCVAGNVLATEAVDRIRLLDCAWPEPLATSFPGPQYGTSVREAIFDAPDRPLTATVPDPTVGLSSEQHATVGYRAWTGGLDLLKDDEKLTDQAFNPFEDRLADSLAERDRAEAETGEPKGYLVNVTAPVSTMLERVDAAAEQGCECVTVEVVTCGWAAVQAVRERCDRLGLAINAEHAVHAAFDQLSDHGVSMRVLAQAARLCGVDQLHTGAAGLGTRDDGDTLGVNESLASPLYGLPNVLPVASGGLHPGLVPELIDRRGTAVVIQAGDGIHGHPDGTRDGARALRAAVDAATAGRAIEDAAADEPALSTALERWGTSTLR